MKILLITEQREAQVEQDQLRDAGRGAANCRGDQEHASRPWSSAKASPRWPTNLPATKLDEVLLVEHDLLAAYTPDGYTVALQQAIAQGQARSGSSAAHLPGARFRAEAGRVARQRA